MRHISSLLAIATVAWLTACSTDRALVSSESLDLARAKAARDRLVTYEERSLRARVLAAIDPRDREDMQRLLENGKPLRMYSKPTIDTLLREITRVRGETIAAMTAAGVVSVPAQVALVDSLPFPATRAVIVRRTAHEPHDLIMLLRTASVDDFYAACATLTKLRLRDGDVPTRDVVVAARQGPASRSWKDDRDVAARHLLDRLRVSAATALPGLGVVRNTSIDFAPTRQTSR